jgi:hypothetical protein
MATGLRANAKISRPRNHAPPQARWSRLGRVCKVLQPEHDRSNVEHGEVVAGALLVAGTVHDNFS